MTRQVTFALLAATLGVQDLGGQAAEAEPRLTNPEEVAVAIRDNYPQPLWDIRASGHPVVRVQYDSSGEVDQVEVLDSGGHRFFAEAAERVARVMRFEPLQVDGERRLGEATRTIDFVTPLPPELANLKVCESPPTLSNREEIREALERFFPRSLLDLGMGGRVVLLLKVDSQGMVWSIEVEQPSEHPALNEAALAVGSFMTFRPGTENGARTPSLVRQTLAFEVR